MNQLVKPTESWAEFEEVGTSDDSVILKGLIFRAGDYPGQDFSMSPEELADVAVGFEPVPIDLSHVSTVLDGQLGQLTDVELSDDGTALMGTVALPRWLAGVIPEAKRKVSCSFDRLTKQLRRLALVPNPQIPDAVLMAAFHAAQPNPEPKVSKMDWLKVFKFWTAAGEPESFDPSAIAKSADFQATPKEVVKEVVPEGYISPEAAQKLIDDLANFQKEVRDRDAARYAAEADAFLSEQVKAERIAPAEKDGLTKLYVDFAKQDAEQPIEGVSRLATFKAGIQARTPANFTKEESSSDALPDGGKILPNGADAPKGVSPERTKYLVSLVQDKAWAPVSAK